MKRIILLSLIMVATVAFISAPATLCAQQTEEWTPTRDTSTNAATTTFTWGSTFNRIGYVAITVNADSLTGGPAGTFYIEGSCMETPTIDDHWAVLASGTINGVNSEIHYSSSTLAVKRLRARCVTTGTSTIELTATGCYKKG